MSTPEGPDRPRSRVVHLSSVHERADTRIFHKQCKSLAARGYDVHLVVADGRGDEVVSKVSIWDVGKPSNRIDRMVRTTRKVLERARELRGSLYHFHDPELIHIGLALKARGASVVFDSHEDVGTQIEQKAYIKAPARKLIATLYRQYEQRAARIFDAIVAATPHIEERFSREGATSVNVNNYPALGELESDIEWCEKRREICYIGSLAYIRGLSELVQALPMVKGPVSLNLAGKFYEPELEEELRQSPGWRHVNYMGHIDRAAVRTVLERSVVGLVTLRPAPNYLDALPVKMFEYMAAGIPVIASDFPLWRHIVTDADCGICVDPQDPRAIAAAISFMLDEPERAAEMGCNGRKAVLEKYNWPNEENKLVNLYCKILKSAKI